MRVPAVVACVLLGACSSRGAPDDVDAAQTEAAVDAAVSPDAATRPVTVDFPRTAIAPDELAVLVNTQDPQSVAVAELYQKKRQIPDRNVIRLSFASVRVLPRADFAALKAQIDAATPAGVQAYALSWTWPYRVDCMSVTSAVALGFDTKYCNTTGGTCGTTAPVAYYGSASTRPRDDLGIRPAMMLAATDAASAGRFIDQGIAADATYPAGTGYFVRTTDVARSVRWSEMKGTVDRWKTVLDLQYVDNSGATGANYIKDRRDVLFYFTGLTDVPMLASNSYRPGAVADHLTSFGGMVPTGSQMSVVRWLEAGVTASYGTTVEPCAITAKFPNTGVLLSAYFGGATVIEAYWKSVQWPGEGLFVGEPLARPWKPSFTHDGQTLTLRTTGLAPGKTYAVEAADSPDGPWTEAKGDITVAAVQLATITVEGARWPRYRLVAR
jgi:uncharacterized protein (TIGR03790 family)